MGEARTNSLLAREMLGAKHSVKQEDSVRQSDVLAAVDAYNAFAPYYESYSAARTAYLRRVEDIIVAQTVRARSVLDVGAGDGIRGSHVAHAVGATRLVLAEPSSTMRALCPQDVEIWPCCAEEIPDTGPLFDLVLCLWNVLGHIDGVQNRLIALSKLKKLLSPGASIFLDVSHRYNAAAYGLIKTFRRMSHDLVSRSKDERDVVVSWQAGGKTIRTQGHVFTHREMKNLFRSAGLKTVKRWVIDYENGEERRLSISGHLLYQLTAA